MTSEKPAHLACRPAIWTGMYHNLALHEAFRSLRDCGWQHFEIASEHLVGIEQSPESARLIDRANARLEDSGATARQAHGLLGAQVAHPDESIREEHLRRLEEHIRIAARIGVRTIVVHPAGLRNSTSNEQDAEIRQLNVVAFRRLGDLAGEHGMRIGLENLMSRGVGTADEMLDLLAAIDHRAIGVTFDTSHANVAHLDIPAAIRALGSHLVATHISDNNTTGDQHLLPGRGTVDWPGFMAALRDIDYKGLLNFEIPGERHCVAAFHRLNAVHARSLAHCMLEMMA